MIQENFKLILMVFQVIITNKIYGKKYNIL